MFPAQNIETFGLPTNKSAVFAYLEQLFQALDNNSYIDAFLFAELTCHQARLDFDMESRMQYLNQYLQPAELQGLYVACQDTISPTKIGHNERLYQTYYAIHNSENLLGLLANLEAPADPNIPPRIIPAREQKGEIEFLDYFFYAIVSFLTKERLDSLNDILSKLDYIHTCDPSQVLSGKQEFAPSVETLINLIRQLASYYQFWLEDETPNKPEDFRSLIKKIFSTKGDDSTPEEQRYLAWERRQLPAVTTEPSEPDTKKFDDQLMAFDYRKFLRATTTTAPNGYTTEKIQDFAAFKSLKFLSPRVQREKIIKDLLQQVPNTDNCKPLRKHYESALDCGDNFNDEASLRKCLFRLQNQLDSQANSLKHTLKKEKRKPNTVEAQFLNIAKKQRVNIQQTLYFTNARDTSDDSQTPTYILSNKNLTHAFLSLTNPSNQNIPKTFFETVKKFASNIAKLPSFQNVHKGLSDAQDFQAFSKSCETLRTELDTHRKAVKEAKPFILNLLERKKYKEYDKYEKRLKIAALQQKVLAEVVNFANGNLTIKNLITSLQRIVKENFPKGISKFLTDKELLSFLRNLRSFITELRTAYIKDYENYLEETYGNLAKEPPEQKSSREFLTDSIKRVFKPKETPDEPIGAIRIIKKIADPSAQALAKQWKNWANPGNTSSLGEVLTHERELRQTAFVCKLS